MDSRDPLATAYDLIHLKDFIEFIEDANKYLESPSKTEDIPTELAIYIKWQKVFAAQVKKYQAIYEEFRNLVVDEATKRKVHDFIKNGNAQDLADFFSVPEHAIIFEFYRKVVPDLQQIQISFLQYKMNTINLYRANDPNFRIKIRTKAPPEAKQEPKTQRDSPIFAKHATSSNQQEINDFEKVINDFKTYLSNIEFAENNYEMLKQMLQENVDRYSREPDKAQQITSDVIAQLNMLVTASGKQYPKISKGLAEIREKFTNITASHKPSSKRG